MKLSGQLSDDKLLEIMCQSPKALAIYSTEEIVVNYANDAMLAFWGKDRRILGKPLEIAVPELEGQPFIDMLKTVYRTGITDTGTAIPAETRINGKLQTSYYSYEYRAILDDTGKTYSILHTAEDVTEAIMNQESKKQEELRKYDFIGMVSHELKTPITSLNGYIQMLHRKAIQEENTFTSDMLVKVGAQLKKMTAMINGFVNISRLELGKIQLNRRLFDLAELLHNTIDDVQLGITTHKLIFTSASPIYIEADHEKIGSVVSNILSNAIKYSPNKETITITCALLDGFAEVCIRDEGIGIDEEDSVRLFQRFYRVKNKDNPHISGFGIGLYLSAEIIQHHGGKIWVKSEKGKGSAFYFNLPVNA